MEREKISSNLTAIAFEFFYKFSRFEFCLKENGYLKSSVPGVPAEPGWRAFVSRWKDEYAPSSEALVLLESPPARQIVGDARQLAWQAVGLADCKSDLERVVRLVCTVRNNLFHGGKHGAAEWDHIERTEALLEASLKVLDQLAELSTLQADYYRHY